MTRYSEVEMEKWPPSSLVEEEGEDGNIFHDEAIKDSDEQVGLSNPAITRSSRVRVHWMDSPLPLLEVSIYLFLLDIVSVCHSRLCTCGRLVQLFTVANGSDYYGSWGQSQNSRPTYNQSSSDVCNQSDLSLSKLLSRPRCMHL